MSTAYRNIADVVEILEEHGVVIRDVQSKASSRGDYAMAEDGFTLAEITVAVSTYDRDTFKEDN